MNPLNLTMRKLVHKYVPTISNANIYEVEKMVALRKQLAEHQTMLGGAASRSLPRIVSAAETKESAIYKDEFAAHEENLKRIHKFWVAGRQLAVQQSKFVRVPMTWERWKRFWPAMLNYRKVQFLTFFQLNFCRLRCWRTNFTLKRIAVLFVMALPVILSVWLLVNQDTQPITPPAEPVEAEKMTTKEQ